MIRYVSLFILVISLTKIAGQELNPPLLISGRITGSRGNHIPSGELRFKIYLQNNEGLYLNETSVSCGYIPPFWFAELGNLPAKWNLGDNLVISMEYTDQNEHIEFIWEIDSSGTVPDLQTEPIPVKKQIIEFQISDRGVFRGIPVVFDFQSIISVSPDIELKIYDANGYEVFRSETPIQTSEDQYQFSWDGKTTDAEPLRSGIYFYFLLNQGKTLHSGVVSLKNE